MYRFQFITMYIIKKLTVKYLTIYAKKYHS